METMTNLTASQPLNPFVCVGPSARTLPIRELPLHGFPGWWLDTSKGVFVMDWKQYEELREQVYAKTDGLCWYCGVDTNEQGYFAMDHVIPQIRGGSDDLDNLVPACRSCNAIKHAHTLEQFRIKMGRNDKWIDFSGKQRRWLRKHAGLNVYDIMSDHYTFWFEEQGLTQEAS